MDPVKFAKPIVLQLHGRDAGGCRKKQNCCTSRPMPGRTTAKRFRILRPLDVELTWDTRAVTSTAASHRAA